MLPGRLKLIYPASEMSRLSTFLLCVFAVLHQWQPWSAVSAHIAPPKGYSVGFSAYIAKGTSKYVCDRGTWIKTGDSATLRASGGSNLGTYGSVLNPVTKETTYYWTIINDPGGFLESGQSKCGLQATPVKTARVNTSSVLEFLAIVKVHRGDGDADQVAFVSLGGTKGGVSPRNALCTSHGATSGVPFSGSFRFYTQDRVPPKVPASLTAKANFLQVVFMEGKMVYKFSAGRWRNAGIFATIRDVAGGNALGKFGTVVKPDRYGSKLFFRFNDPNGFWMWGQDCARPVQMTADAMPWQLLKITTSGGTQSPLGKYTYALMGATMGGRSPGIAPTASGVTWSSRFTAQCYLYTA